jgi:TetR/AcrR family transcriptional regulator, cholesterol catabolism regulator
MQASLAYLHQELSPTPCNVAFGQHPAPLRLKLIIYISFLTEVMQPWFYFAYMEAKNLDKTQRKRSIENELFTEQIFNEILQEGHESGIFTSDRPTLTAGAVKALLQDWYVKRWKYTRRQVSVEDYAEFVINFVESAIMAVSTPELS